MIAYLKKSKKLMKAIPTTSIEVMSRSKNANTDALAKLAPTKDVYLIDVVSIEFLA